MAISPIFVFVFLALFTFSSQIQNIRSRLFLGKQAKIKEMYQQAVADSEQCKIRLMI